MSCFGDAGKDQEKKWHEILAKHEGEEDLTLALLNDKEYQQLCDDIVSSFNPAKLPEYDLLKQEKKHTLKGKNAVFVLGNLIGDLNKISEELDEIAAGFVGIDDDNVGELDGLINNVCDIVTDTIYPKICELEIEHKG